MTRRDMIIIAILVNAGLLAILFMMAINSDTDTVMDQVEMKQQIAEITPQVINTNEVSFIPATGMDEGDNALKDYNANAGLPIIPEEGAAVGIELQPAAAEVVVVEAPLPVEAPADDQDGKIVEVTVKSGDSLDKIARENSTTIKAIKDENKLKSSKLQIGQVLKVPVSKKKPAKAAEKVVKATPPVKTQKAAPKDPVASSDAEFYTVKAGDNPWKIAKKFKIKVDDLLKLNNLDETKARNMQAGDKIRVK